MEDPDGELLTRISETKDFVRRVLYDDSLDDWNLAKDFGEFLLRLDPEEILGHALLARAYRHLGNSERALEELERCRVRVTHGQLRPLEREFFPPFLAEEDRLLSGNISC
jgi:tetratricopeptide (TPR) repeat protein